jgi:hypothetical protein
MSGKTIGIVLVLLVLVGGGYYFVSMKGGANIPALSGMNDSQDAVSGGTAAVPAQSGSVEDFSASIDSELQATAAGMKDMDAQTDASVSGIQLTGDSSRLYDPNNL